MQQQHQLDCESPDNEEAATVVASNSTLPLRPSLLLLLMLLKWKTRPRATCWPPAASRVPDWPFGPHISIEMDNTQKSRA